MHDESTVTWILEMAQILLQLKIRQMGKEAKMKHSIVCAKNYYPYQFRLKGKSSLFYQGTVQVSFEPVKALDFDSGSQTLRSYSILPRFNLDGRYYSQAFSSQFEGVQTDTKLKSEHDSRLKQLSTQIVSTKILLPKPRSSKVCFVCRRQYTDYLQHIKSDLHQKCIRKSVYDRYINELIEKVRKGERGKLNNKKKQMI